jgi:tetratricopeptide (TPR) repeat protein
MNSKIDWYREVLALEPGSRVFFPLAQLLRAGGRDQEAVAALRGGLAFHPDHLEAKFLLAELLDAPGQPENAAELAETLDCLSAILSRYPSFWTQWADRLAADSREAALAARLLAAHLGGTALDLLGILEQGVAAQTSSAAAAKPAPVQEPDEGDAGLPPPLRGADEVRAALDEIAPQPQVRTAPEPAGGPYSGVRTRTMANVLAGQGDVKGALEIYQELLAVAPEGEKTALAERIAELKQTLQPTAAASPETGGPDKNKLMGVLELLAGRLEARAGG